MRLTHLRGLAAAVALGTFAPAALAAPLATQPGVTSITVYETTASTIATVFAINDPRLTTKLGSSLGVSASDLTFFPGEYYDFFLSNADGTFNAHGSYFTIEGVWWPNDTNTPSPFGGMNINEVTLDSGASHDYADTVASYVMGSICNTSVGANCGLSSAGLAVDHDLSSFPRFGQTDVTNRSEHFRLTVGFNGVSDAPSGAPEPSVWALAVAGFGLAGAGLRRRRVGQGRI